MILNTKCEMSFQIETPTPFVFMLRPRSGLGQSIQQETYEVSPNIPITEATDVYGNLCQRLVAPIGRFDIRTTSVVSTSAGSDEDSSAAFIPVEQVPDEVLMYLLPSRYCEADRHNAQALSIVGDAQPGYEQVSRIVNWMRTNVNFVPWSSSVPISATEVMDRGFGVCRDLAHVGISLCRSICIPARMVVGYLHNLDPMDIHAWFEVYVGNRWYTVDATQADLHGARIAIAYGRDAADVAICNQYGPAVDPFHILVEVTG